MGIIAQTSFERIFKAKMIKEGQQKRARYWGKFKVEKVVKLPQPVICHSEEIGEVEFMPTMVQIDWEKPPSS
jgi:hypothetical protein